MSWVKQKITMLFAQIAHCGMIRNQSAKRYETNMVIAVENKDMNPNHPSYTINMNVGV